MRRLVFSVIVASGLVMIGAGPAFAEAAPAAAETKAVPGKKMCKVVDPKLNELSGLVTTKTGYVVIDDSTDVPSHKRVFFLNQDCAITKSVAFTGNGPRDTEDMVLSADSKTLWIADTGDNDAANDNRRSTVSLWSMPVSGAAKPKIHRLAYPSGDYHDSEALLMAGNTPIIVTKELGKPAVFYQPTAALKTDNETGVPMKKVGEFQPPETDTASSSYARLLRKTITGAAIAPGGKKVVLRTSTDAYEWDVTGDDVVGALKKTPRKTPLVNEPYGEAIAYSTDGKYFYTVNDMQGSTETTGENANYIMRYTPATKVVTASTDGSGNDKSTGAAWYSDLSLDDITYIVGGVGALGAILVAFGVVGIMRARKKPPLEAAGKVVDGGPVGPLPIDAETELLAVGGPTGRPGGLAQGQRPGVYGGGNRPGGALQPGVYGGAPAAPSVPQRGAPAAPSVPQRGGAPAAHPVPQRGGPPQRGGVYGGQGGGQQGGGRPGQPGGRPPQGGGRPPQGGGRPAQGGQPGGRPPQGIPPGGRPARGGVYGPPAPPPPPPSGRGPAQRPSGFFGQGEPEGRRQAGADSYADANGPSRANRHDNPGYSR